MAAKGARVHIYGDWDGAGVKRAQQDLGTFQRQAQGFSGAISKSMLGVGAAFGGAFAIGSLVGNAIDFLQDASKAALEDQKSVVALSKALDNLGLAHSQPAIESFIGQLQLATGVADTDLRPAYQKLVTATGDVAKAQTLLNLSMDVAAATGKDLGAVSQAMARASLGQVSALTRLGIPLDANIIKTKDFAAAQQVLTEKFGGQAAAAAETYEGKMRRLSVAVDEAKETIGYALVSALDEAATSMGGPDGFIPVITLGGQMVADMVTGVGQLIVKMAELAAAGKDAAGDGEGGMGGFLSTVAQAGVILAGLVPGVGQIGTVAYAAGTQLMGMGQEARLASEQMAALSESANGGDVALAKSALGMGAVSRAAYDATVDMEALTDAVKSYLGILSLSQAQDDFAKDMADLGKTLDGNRRSFNGLGDGAKENRDVLRGALGDAARIVQQMVDEGKISADEARTTFAQMRGDIIDGFVKKGFKRKDVRAFIDAEGVWNPFLTSLPGQLEPTTTAAGKGIGKDLGKGIAAGFRASQSAVNAAVRAGIVAAEAAGRDEAESNSPSLVFARIGVDLSKGLAKGVKDGTPEAVAAAADLVGKVAGAAAQAAKQSAESALQAVRGISDGIVGQVLGGVGFSLTDAEGNALTPEQIVQSLVGSIANQQQAVSAIAANIGQALPPALLQQILGMPPDTAIALANYLGQNPALLQQLTLAYDALSTFTMEALGVPMGLAWGKVGEESAAEMLQSARTYLRNHADSFARFVGNTLSGSIPFSLNLPGRANGGPVTGGSPYIVGERGPEVFVPSQSGTIVPNGRSAGGASVNVTVNAGMGADGYQIGAAVVDAIKKYERVAGPVFAAA